MSFVLKNLSFEFKNDNQVTDLKKTVHRFFFKLSNRLIKIYYPFKTLFSMYLFSNFQVIPILISTPLKCAILLKYGKVETRVENCYNLRKNHIKLRIKLLNLIY